MVSDTTIGDVIAIVLVVLVIVLVMLDALGDDAVAMYDDQDEPPPDARAWRDPWQDCE